MLQSKFHRPWQPRVSDSQPYNPSAHTTEADVSFSAAIGEVEEAAHPPAADEAAVAARAGHSAESAESASPAAPESQRGPISWYTRLVERFAKH
jgi:hypothetical protein